MNTVAWPYFSKTYLLTCKMSPLHNLQFSVKYICRNVFNFMGSYRTTLCCSDG